MFFTLRVVKPWNRWPRGVVEGPSLGIFKVRFDQALNNLVQLKISLLMVDIGGPLAGLSGP